MKKFKTIWIFFCILVVCLCSIYLCQSSISVVEADETTYNISIKQLNEETVYNYINSPKLITPISDGSFYIADVNNNIFLFSNNTLTPTNLHYDNLVDLCWYGHYLYILTNDSLFKYSPNKNAIEETICDGTLSNVINLCVNENGCFIAQSTFVTYIDNRYGTQINCNKYDLGGGLTNFNSVKYICLKADKSLVVAHASDNFVIISKFSLNGNPYNSFAHTSSKAISSSVTPKLKIEVYNSTFYISYENKLYSMNDDTSVISDLFTTTPKIAPTMKIESAESGEIVNLSDFCIIENKLFICDGHISSNRVQSFDITNNNFNFEKLLIASSGFDTDRLYKPSDITINKDNTIYILDSGNNRIICKNLETKTCSVLKSNMPSLVAIATDTDNVLYTLSNNSSRQTLNRHKENKIESKDITDYTICDIEFSTTDILYMLDYVNKKLLKLDDFNTISVVSDLSTLTLSSSARIKLNTSGDELYLLTDNTIYSTNLTETNPTFDNKISVSDELIDFVVDYKNNIYCLVKKTSGYKLEKYSSSGLMKEETANSSSLNYDLLYLNLSNATIYGIDKTVCKVDKINISNNFINKLSDFENDYSFRDKPTDNGATFAIVKSNCQSYAEPFNVTPIQSLEKDDLVIVLNKHTIENSNFAYIMIANKEHYNILSYIDNKFLDYENVKDEELDFNTIQITASAYLYYYPTGEKFLDNDKTCKFMVEAKDSILNVIGHAYGYLDYSEVGYYTVKLDDGTICYIKDIYAIDVEKTKPTVTLQSDAKVKKTLATDIIYIYDYDAISDTYTKTAITLENGEYIQLIGNFDNSAKYSHIKYLNAESQLVSGYIETKFIEYEDITLLRIVGIIMLIIAIVLIIITVSILIAYRKKRLINNLSSINKNNAQIENDNKQ